MNPRPLDADTSHDPLNPFSTDSSHPSHPCNLLPFHTQLSVIQKCENLSFVQIIWLRDQFFYCHLSSHAHNFMKSRITVFFCSWKDLMLSSCPHVAYYSGSIKNIKAIQLSPVKIRQIFPHHYCAKAQRAHELSDPEHTEKTHSFLSW